MTKKQAQRQKKQWR